MLPTNQHKHPQLYSPKGFPSSVTSTLTSLTSSATTRLWNRHQQPPNCVSIQFVFCKLTLKKFNENKIKYDEENDDDKQDYDNIIF